MYHCMYKVLCVMDMLHNYMVVVRDDVPGHASWLHAALGVDKYMGRVRYWHYNDVVVC